MVICTQENIMTSVEKDSLIEKYENQGAQVRAWSILPTQVLDFRPSVEKWTIREHLVHLLDADLNAITRARKAIAEPGSPIYAYEEELWTARLAYGQVDLNLVVELFIGLRKLMAQTLKAIKDQDWGKLVYIHPKNGPMDLAAFLEGYIEHVEFHREYIEKLISQGK